MCVGSIGHKAGALVTKVFSVARRHELELEDTCGSGEETARRPVFGAHFTEP